jgi:4-hydroxy-tetrahydrodipicolinate synthase
MLERGEVDYAGLKGLVEFQNSQRVSGILATGTTGESSTLTWEDHIKVIEEIHDNNIKATTIAGTGSNSTAESINGTQHAVNMGIGAVLLVEPYYNGPSSLEIRKEYIGPIASRFPDLQIIPYVIPGRTGTQLFPQDLAILQSEYTNVSAVKEATGDLNNIRMTRKLCSKTFNILSGDDDITYSIMTDDDILASGVISVASNVAPHAIQKMTRLILEGNMREANKMHVALKPLFNIVTVKTMEETSFGPVLVKGRNPLPYKTLMNILGMPSGPLRPPLGKMTKKGIETVIKTVRSVYECNPEILEPIESAFDVDLSDRLYNEDYLKGLTYD